MQNTPPNPSHVQAFTPWPSCCHSRDSTQSKQLQIQMQLLLFFERTTLECASIISFFMCFVSYLNQGASLAHNNSWCILMTHQFYKDSCSHGCRESNIVHTYSCYAHLVSSSSYNQNFRHLTNKHTMTSRHSSHIPSIT